MGIASSQDLRPWHVLRRTGPDAVHHYGEIHRFLEPGALLEEPLPEGWGRACHTARADTFGHQVA